MNRRRLARRVWWSLIVVIDIVGSLPPTDHVSTKSGQLHSFNGGGIWVNLASI